MPRGESPFYGHWRGGSPVVVYDDARFADFDEGGVLEGVGDQSEVGLEQGEQVVVGNVAGGDHEEPAWKVLQ